MPTAISKPRYKEYDVVRLLTNLPGYELSTGVLGAVLLVYPGIPPHYEVEFIDDKGQRLALLTVNENQVELAMESLS